MKLWLDDIREAPKGWKWAKTANEAIMLLKTGKVTEASLDHDLTFDHYSGTLDYRAETGYDVICWMEHHNIWPDKTTVHSMNPAGRKRMEQVINKHYENN